MTGQAPRPLDRPCSEQGKLPIAKAFTLAERDKHMSEQELNMAEVDEWIDSEVITSREVPDVGIDASEEELEKAWDRANDGIRHKVRQKIQEAHNSGFKAGARHVREETRVAAAEIFRLMTRIFR